MEGLKQAAQEYLKARGCEASPTESVDEDLEQVLDLVLNRLPASLGELSGSMLAMVLDYSDFCGWDEEARDTETFLARLEEGFRAGLRDYAKKAGDWPNRAALIALIEQRLNQIHALSIT